MRSKSQAVRRQAAAAQFFASSRGSGQPLDSGTRTFMESRFAHDFSRVRVHTDRHAAQSAESVGASAYTVGSDVVFGAGAFDRQRLAHELTHVVQQSRSGASSTTSTEAEARMNANRIAAGLTGQVRAAAAPGTVQCEEPDDKKKKKAEAKELENKFSVDSQATVKPGEVKNKVAFKGEAAIPLGPGFTLGHVVFLDKPTLTFEGEKEEKFDPAKPHIPGPGDIKDVKAEAKVPVLKIEKLKIEKKGFSLGAGFEAGAALKYATGKGIGLGAEAEATGEAAYKSPSLLPPEAGKLTLGTSIKGTGSAGVSLDEKPTAKATGTFTAGAEYKSPTLRGPFGTFFGILGEKANLTIGAEGKLTGTAETGKNPSAKASVGGSIGLTGAGPQQPFLKATVTGEGVLGNPLMPVFGVSVGGRF
jgi:Domain of unknown function (DUF4157)